MYIILHTKLHNIISLRHAFYTWQNLLFFSELSHFIPLKAQVIWSLLQIVSAVQYCHQKKIIHRDLKVKLSYPTSFVFLFT